MVASRAAGGDGCSNVVLVTTPPPTPNGPLHIGHLSGPYIAADVALRAARARGEHVLTMSGLDSHQNYVLAKAEAEGRPAEDLLRSNGLSIRKAFSLARIDYDLFLDPSNDPEYRGGVADLLAELIRADAIKVRETPLPVCDGCGRTLHHAYVVGVCPVCSERSGGGTCERCGCFTTAANLKEPRSICCGAAPAWVREQLPLLRLEDYRDQLVQVWASAELPAPVRRLVDHYLAVGLPDVVVGYPTNWGIEMGAPFLNGWRVDVWAEMALGYLYAVARQLDPSARTVQQCVAAWRHIAEIWHFLGIDNAFYYAILFPAMFAAVGMPPGKLRGLIVNQFYRLDGLKFSTSRNHAIWAHEFLAEEDPGLVRAYVCWDRPDRYESDFTHEAYGAFCALVSPLFGGSAAPRFAPGLAAAEVSRAKHALGFSGFDPALAVRCLLAAMASDWCSAQPLLALVTANAARPFAEGPAVRTEPGTTPAPPPRPLR